MCGIVGGGHLAWVVLLVLRGVSWWGINGSEWVTCLVLEIRRIDFLLSVLVLLWCWTLGVALARSCIVPGSLYSHCGDGFST